MLISLQGMFSFITGSTAISFKVFVAFHWLLLINSAGTFNFTLLFVVFSSTVKVFDYLLPSLHDK